MHMYVSTRYAAYEASGENALRLLLTQCGVSCKRIGADYEMHACVIMLRKHTKMEISDRKTENVPVSHLGNTPHAV